MMKKLKSNIKITEEYLYDLLYNKSNLELISVIKDITDSKLLHMIMANYNWDDGIEIPKTVIANSFCDLGTALMVFSFFGGYEFLLDDEENAFSESEKDFLSDLHERIKNKKFSNQSIKYIPELTRADKYHIKKSCPDISNIFLEGTEGELLDIILV